MSNENSKIKILVGYHKPSSMYLSSNIITPVWGGKDIAMEPSKDGLGLSQEGLRWMESHTIGDNTGDNISKKNRNYCEATILYWAWKNYEKLGNPNYLGFMQYRRVFISDDRFVKNHTKNFNTFYQLLEIPKYYSDLFMDAGYAPHYDGRNIAEEIEGYDAIFTVAVNSKKNPYSYLSDFHREQIKYFDMAIEIIKSDFPEYAQSVEEYFRGHKFVWSNCFVMKREDYIRYCEFMFGVLFKIEPKVDYSTASVDQARLLGYIAECLTGVFYIRLLELGRKIKSLPLTHVLDTDLTENVLVPKFAKNNVPVVFSTNQTYIPILATALRSLIDNRTQNHNYDIIILNDGTLSSVSRTMILDMQEENVSIRFYNISDVIGKKTDVLNTNKQYTKEIYFRLFIPEIMKNYAKSIYLDSDVILNDDIANLYEIDLENNWVGAVPDVIGRSRSPFFRHVHNILQSAMGMKDPVSSYFNSGVMVMDIEKLNENNFLANFLTNYLRKMPRELFDQDILNATLEGHVYYLPVAWNLMSSIRELGYKPETAPAWLYLENLNIVNTRSFKLLHYCGHTKPWLFPESSEMLFQDEFWKYARRTPFYEILLLTMVRNVTMSPYQEITRLQRKIWKYKILQFLSLGLVKSFHKRKAEYRMRLKALLQSAES